MREHPDIPAIVYALGLPPEARIDARVPKKLLVEQGAPTPADKRAIQDGIDELQWFAACKPATIGVPAFADDSREYLEIAIVGCAFRAGAKASRLIELIHRAIPYPVLLVTADSNGIAISGAHKRRAQNEAGKTVIERVAATAGLRPQAGIAIEAAFLHSLSLAKLPHSELYVLYDSWIARIEALNAARLTGVFNALDDRGAAEERRKALEEHERLSREAARLAALAVRTKQINHKIDLNIQLQVINEKLDREKHLLSRRG